MKLNRFYIIFLGLFMLKAEAQSSAFTVADSLYALGDYAKAINHYAKIDDLKAKHQIARAYNAMRNYDKAVLQYRSVIKKDSSNILAQFELGKIYDKTKKYAAAIALFQRLTKNVHDNPEFFHYLGKAQQHVGDIKNGNEALAKAVLLDSTHLRSIYLLGKYYVSVREPGHAHEIIDLGLRTAPEDVALINLKALAYFDSNDHGAAIPLFEKLLELGEKKPFVYKKLGFSANYEWEFEKAKTAYRELAKILNYEPDAYLGLGQVFLKEKELDSAEVYFLKSIEERRYIFDQEYASLGRVARLKKDTKKAMDYYLKAWEESPENQLYYYQVCTFADEYYKDPKTKLRYYEKLLAAFPQLLPFIKERAKKRIAELKEEIHFTEE